MPAIDMNALAGAGFQEPHWQWLKWIDLDAMVLVLGGVLLATMLRCGVSQTLRALAAVLCLVRPRWPEIRVKARMAVQLREIDRAGLYAADPVRLGDRDTERAVEVLLSGHGRTAMETAFAEHRHARQFRRQRHAEVLQDAADLSPVFGLIGTLVALADLPGGGIAESEIGAVVSGAVLTTLYGALLANLVFGPLAARMLARGRMEEDAREQLETWFAAEVEAAAPPRGLRVANPVPVAAA